MTYHIAQLNIAEMRAPLDDPVMVEFVEALDPINALADRSPGFVWRLQDDSGDATSIQVFEDETTLVNMSVWESVEALKDFVYKSAHAKIMRRKREWFDAHRSPCLVLWWIRKGHIPAAEEAVERLQMLTDNGPSPHAFTLSMVFPGPSDD